MITNTGAYPDFCSTKRPRVFFLFECDSVPSQVLPPHLRDPKNSFRPSHLAMPIRKLLKITYFHGLARTCTHAYSHLPVEGSSLRGIMISSAFHRTIENERRVVSTGYFTAEPNPKVRSWGRKHFKNKLSFPKTQHSDPVGPHLTPVPLHIVILDLNLQRDNKRAGNLLRFQINIDKKWKQLLLPQVLQENVLEECNTKFSLDNLRYRHPDILHSNRDKS